ncbi:MAG TPA: immune inhibitor A domain-containing protein [Gemmatimonadales bacterium]|nr:immune inhibitor A domain-containing protein [Gemmatimonadales bacterium]
MSAAPTRAPAQGRLHPRREIPGFDFRASGAFRPLARQVAARRRALLARRDFAALNAALTPGGPAAPGAAVTGTFQIPAVLFTFRDTPLPLPAGRDTASYTAVVFGATPPLGRPYTERTFYEQMSHGLMSLQGHALGYVALDSNEVHYAGKPTCSGNPYGTANCNGLFSTAAVDSMQTALQEALRKVDNTIHPDWSTFAYDPATGVLNFVIFLQPALDGACGGAANNHFWSHRFYLQSPYTTQTPWPGHPGRYLQISDYTLQSAVGGASACDSTAIMPIGTSSEETGHAFGLPDLYDLSEATSGVGVWSLMSFGVYTAPLSPSRMDAWSLNELGWITVVPLTASGTYSVGPVTPATDTVFLVTAQDSNPRGEYFLLENRAAALADTALIAHVCAVSGTPPGCGGGLLIWHVDSTQIANTEGLNTVNVGPIHGLELVQADGVRNLDRNPSSDPLANRGDAGDPYPGVASNPAFTLRTTPAATKNCCNQGFVGFAIDSIRLLAPGGAVSFRLRFGVLRPLATADVVAQLLTGTSSLTPADLVALDLLGNNNGRFDVGDFLAWVQATGVPLTAPQWALVGALSRSAVPR